MTWLQGIGPDNMLRFTTALFSLLAAIVSFLVVLPKYEKILKYISFGRFYRGTNTVVKSIKEIRKLDRLREKCKDDLLIQEINDQRKAIDSDIARKRYMRLLDNERINHLRSKEMSYQPAVFESGTLFFTLLVVETLYFSWKGYAANTIIQQFLYTYSIAFILISLLIFSIKILWWRRRREGFKDFIEPLFKEYSYESIAESELIKGIKAFQEVYGEGKLKGVALFVNVSFLVFWVLACLIVFFLWMPVHGFLVLRIRMWVILLVLVILILALVVWRIATRIYKDKILELGNLAEQQMAWFKPYDRVNPPNRWYNKIAWLLRRCSCRPNKTKQVRSQAVKPRIHVTIQGTGIKVLAEAVDSNPADIEFMVRQAVNVRVNQLFSEQTNK